MTIQQAYQQILADLYSIYDDREAANIAEWIIENVTGFKKIDRILNKSFPLNSEQLNRIQDATKELLDHRPIQYVLGEAFFAGMRLFVDKSVLIPRPETEELVEWIISEVESGKVRTQGGKSEDETQEQTINILDIGTGSGCIPIAIKRKISWANVYAIDVSEDALTVAKRNASEQDALVHLMKVDFLNEEAWNELQEFDIIISNPPYIKQSEEALMQKNVLNFEPHIALFVPDSDALIFYRKIAAFAQAHLKPEGIIFLEINEALGNDVTMLFKEGGYGSVEIRKDMQGKDRMVKVQG